MSAPVDVLAVMDRAVQTSSHTVNFNMLAARAAVADMLQLLRDIRDCGEWYRSALEIDTYAGHGHDGESLKTRLDDLLARCGGAK